MVKTIEDKYRFKDPRQHVLDRPQNYIGSMIFTDREAQYVIKDNVFIQEELQHVPAFVKIFDEILTNSLDHYKRDKKVSEIRVSINPDTNEISVYNNGSGIEIAIHKEKKVYIPEMVFGEVFTSSNYDDDEKKDWIGINGIGAKATNIFSTKFIIETVHNGKMYYQEFSNNMSEKTQPVITPYKKEPYTKITYYPDLIRFNMKKIDRDTFKMLEKRVYDATITSHNNLKHKLSIYFNEKLIDISRFIDYVKLYDNPNEKYIENTKNWQIILCKSKDDVFSQVSFVNCIPTSRGGKHVDLIVNQLIKKITDILSKRNKNLQLKPQFIKNKISLFLYAQVDNPKFDTQTKDHLVSSMKDVNIEVSDKLVKVFLNDIMEEILSISKFYEDKALNKKLNGKKNTRNLNIHKLDDAYFAGTDKSYKCSLVLTEGDSAKTGVLAGLQSKDKDYIGIFPMKGKMLNIQEATQKQLETNEEVKSLMAILGLQKGEKYKDVKSLRYGEVYLCTDQDQDGYHCAGLIMNFFRTWFPELLALNFLKKIKTPVIRVNYKKNPIFFYNLSDYDDWRKKHMNEPYKTEYKKGLGSLTKDEAKLFFGNVSENNFTYLIDRDALKNVDLAFSKKHIEDRKEWLSEYDTNDSLDYNEKNINITGFIHKELKHFSIYDNVRSIPNLVDGFKPSQRKVLYGCFKRNLTQPIRVAQLAGYISEHAEYHHGEASLQGTIINMAQNFVGSNNVNLLVPVDQFGSRTQLGKDASSPRYIHTYIHKDTYKLFPDIDNKLVEFNKGDEGELIEPVCYYPILPMVLINGSKGIGTGYSTDIPLYNPEDIKKYIINKLQGKKQHKKLIPWYRNFKGKIEEDEAGKYKCRGVYEKISDFRYKITEIPVNISTEKYKEYLDTLIDKDILTAYKNNSTADEILFEVKFKSNVKDVENTLWLVNNINTSNMTLFSPDGKIRKYSTPEEIIDEYFIHRYKMYEKRKVYILKYLVEDIKNMTNKIRFIESVINNTIKVFRQKKEDVVKQLEINKFEKQNGDYNYLTKMPIDIFTKEEIEKLEKKKKELVDKHKLTKETSETATWINEIELL
jgi:DNA topoisomerase-2